MNKTSFRALLGILTVAVVVALYRVYFAAPDLPYMAVSYIEWWRTQPMSTLQLMILTYAAVVHAVLLLSLAGLAFFWSPARHVFVACMAILMFGEIGSRAPLVVPANSVALDNLIAVLSGMVILAAYSKPISEAFSLNPFRKRSSSGPPWETDARPQ